MKVFSLVFFAIYFIVANVYSQQESVKVSKSENAIDEYRKDFWMTTETTQVGKYLIKVALPTGYYKSDTTSYPVFYLTDADWFFGTAVDRAFWLSTRGSEIIVLGISYGSSELCWTNRRIDFSSDGRGAFLSFIRDELIPEIESTYRVDKANRTLFTWSSSFGFYVINKNAELFHNYLQGGGNPQKEWIDTLFQKRKDLPIRLYIGNGDLDLYAHDFSKTVQYFQSMNFEGLEFEWELYPGKGHEYATVSDLLSRGMNYIYRNKDIVIPMLKTLDEKGVDAAIEKYHTIKTTYPDDYNFGSGNDLDHLARGLSSQQRYHEAAEINKLIIQEYPDFWLAYYKLGSYYMYEEKNELAKKYFLKALELNPGHEESLERLEKVQE